MAQRAPACELGPMESTAAKPSGQLCAGPWAQPLPAASHFTGTVMPTLQMRELSLWRFNCKWPTDRAELEGPRQSAGQAHALSLGPPWGASCGGVPHTAYIPCHPLTGMGCHPEAGTRGLSMVAEGKELGSVCTRAVCLVYSPPPDSWSRRAARCPFGHLSISVA